MYEARVIFKHSKKAEFDFFGTFWIVYAMPDQKQKKVSEYKILLYIDTVC